MAAKGKEFSNKRADFAKGGNTPMFSEQSAENQKPGQTGDQGKAGPGAKFAAGGSTKMFGFRPAGAAKAGQTGQ